MSSTNRPIFCHWDLDERISAELASRGRANKELLDQGWQILTDLILNLLVLILDRLV
jgi:hypothetical protein